MNRLLNVLGAAAIVGFFALGGLADSATAKVQSQCPTCDQLNNRGPGQGGPGFYDFDFHCSADGGVVTAKVTTAGQPGHWTAGLNSTQIDVVGTATISVGGVYHGADVTRWLMRPDGTYAIPPTTTRFDCGDCDAPPTSSVTIPPSSPSTVPGSSTTVPRPPSSSPGTTIAHKVPTLPATGVDTGTILLIGSIGLCLGALLVIIFRR